VITLYGPRASPFVEKVVRGLALKRLDFALVEPSSPEDYRRWNPETGLLPLLEIDGERVHDSTAILLRVNELFPEPPLLSRDPRAAESQLRLVHWVDETFFWYWNRWVRRPGDPAVAGPFVALAGESLAEAERRRRSGASLRATGGSLRAHPQSAHGSEAEGLAQEAGRRVDDLARLLAPRPFFFADRIGIADLAAYAMLRAIALDSIPGTRRELLRHPALLAFMERVEQETDRKPA
jgi:glutathione S-transferase